MGDRKMTIEYKDAATIKASLERLYHERAHITNQLSTGEGNVKAAPLRLKGVADDIHSLEELLKKMEVKAAK